ncbi:G-protein coupled estrogen receptor 1-like [Lampris incognitus]|uniref:G-protein coupled estrogen receptor 1-like n=1 Tax=Lampris incognitus TaxID=2546036 RepID=UPI0024B616B0|nr:G-protein coupled estrogen receptor 1-like [Lampris incognitus]
MNLRMYAEYPEATGKNVTMHPAGSLAAVSSLTRETWERHEHYAISLFLSSLYTIFLFPVGFIGNILIPVVNLDRRGQLTAPDLYFVNLAVADFILVADSLIEVFNLRAGYYDVAALCTFMALLQQINMYSSVFFLTWMSFDRYKALTGAMGRGVPHARLSCCLIWVSSSLLAMLPFIVEQARHAGDQHFCYANMSQVQWLEVTLGFLAPFFVLGVCYWRIWQSLSHGHWEQCGLQRRPRRQKALQMISAAVLVFFICWLPKNVFVSVHLLRGDVGGSTLWHDYPLTAHMVNLAAFSNSCLNPLIYSFLGETFRNKLRLFLRQKASWAKLYCSTSGNSTSSPEGILSRTICKGRYESPPFFQSSTCLPQAVTAPLNQNSPQLFHHTPSVNS